MVDVSADISGCSTDILVGCRSTLVTTDISTSTSVDMSIKTPYKILDPAHVHIIKNEN